jgi:hypothetical protein
MNAALIVLALTGGPTLPPGTPSVDTKAEAEEAGVAARTTAAEFDVRIDGTKLRMEPVPVLRWTNHLGRRFYGIVYVWTRAGRPEVVATITTIFTNTKSTHTEIQSLSTNRPVLARGGKVVWEPASAGVGFTPLPGAPRPAATAGARLLQMKSLARQFSVVADYGFAKEQREELRLLAAPVFRYASAARGVTDGALFAFTKGTDPDAFLLIEARGKPSAPEWQYALARFSGSCALRATLRGKEVWRVGRLPGKTTRDPKQPYSNFR